MALMSGAIHVLQWPVQWGSNAARWSQTHKAGPSSDCGLQLAHMKAESLVIADQQAAVNTFPGLVHTARHTTKARCNRSRCSNPQGGKPPKLWLEIGRASCRERVEI